VHLDLRVNSRTRKQKSERVSRRQRKAGQGEEN
jgi:hypothetical protein